MEKTFDTHSIACTSFYTIDRIAEEGGKHGGDALLLYFKYQEKSNIDLTNQPWATDTYMMKGLGWGKDKFYKAKNVLIKMGLVENVQDKSDGKFGKTYIRVNFRMKLDDGKTVLLEHRTTGEPYYGETETNAYSTKVSAYSTKINDISKDISACATDEQTNTQCPKLAMIQQITATQIRSEYKCPTNRKGNIKDVEKIMNGLSLEEQICALREVRLLTFELRLGIIEKMRCTTCAHAIENRTDDETMIIERVENIVNKFKNHKCKKAETKKEREDEIKEFFGGYLEYTQQPEPTSKEERIKEYEKFASNGQQSKFKEVYPKADVKKIYEDWIMRCVSGRK